MIHIKETKINNVNIEPMKPIEENKNVLGYDMFNSISATVFIYAPPRSGKTTLIKNIVDNCIDEATKTYIFCSTIYSETMGGYEEILESMDKKKIDYEVYDSIYTIEEKSNISRTGVEKITKQKVDDLEDIYNSIKKSRKSLTTDTKKCAESDMDLLIKYNDNGFNVEVKKKKKKKLSPKYCFIFDDIAGQLKNNLTLEVLFREFRHTHIKLIIASQTILDIPADCRKLVQYHILLGGIPEDHLEYAYSAMTPKKLSLKDFIELYKHCTNEKYNFLMYNKETGEFRRNFNTIIEF